MESSHLVLRTEDCLRHFFWETGFFAKPAVRVHRFLSPFPQNLWPESFLTEPWNAHVKDKLENLLHRLVVSGKLDLKNAQREIATDWIATYKKYVGSEPPKGKKLGNASKSTPEPPSESDLLSGAESVREDTTPIQSGTNDYKSVKRSGSIPSPA